MGNRQDSDNGNNCHKCNLARSTFNKLLLCPVCKLSFCSKCLDYPIHLSEEKVESSKLESAGISLDSVCLGCFKKKCSIDFERQYDVIGQENEKSIIWLHGGGSCRKMFQSHALVLKDRGYRSILVDLPGHGSLMDMPLTRQTCIQTVVNIRKSLCKTAPVLIGGSFGGALIMEIMQKHWSQQEFRAAIVCMAGQNTGVGRSNLASFGLWAMQKALNNISTGTLVQGLLKQAKYVKKQELVSMMRAGYYFNQGSAQIEFLKQTNPVVGLKKFEGPILFINGDKDHRDSEELWKNSSKNAKLKVYKGADHFFSHDTRYMDNFIKDINTFLDQVYEK